VIKGRRFTKLMPAIALSLLAFSLTACESGGSEGGRVHQQDADAPKWVKTANADDIYNPRVYLTGIGITQYSGDMPRDLRAAEQKARRNILETLIVKVESEFNRRVHEFVGSAETSTSTSNTLERIKTSTAGWLPSEMKDGKNYHDKGTDNVYVLMAVNRGDLADKLGARLRSSVARQNALLGTMRSRRAEKRALESLRAYPEMMAVTEEIAILASQRDVLLNQQSSDRFGAVTAESIEVEREASLKDCRTKIVVTGQGVDRKQAENALKAEITKAELEVVQADANYNIELELVAQTHGENLGSGASRAVTVGRIGWVLRVRNTSNNAEVYTRRSNEADSAAMQAVVSNTSTADPVAEALRQALDKSLVKINEALGGYLVPPVEAAQ